MLALKTAIWEKFLNNQRHHLLKVHHWPWAQRSCPRSTVDSSRHFQTSNWINTNNFSVNQNHTRCPQRSLIKLQANPRLFTFEISQVNFNIFIFLDSNLCICVQNLNISVTMVTMRRRKARQIWIAIKYWFADDNDEWYLYFHLFICLWFCFIIFPVSKCVYLCSKTQSLCEYSDNEEEEGKTNINFNCYQILNRWYGCLFIKFLSLSSSLHHHHLDLNSQHLFVIPIAQTSSEF